MKRRKQVIAVLLVMIIVTAVAPSVAKAESLAFTDVPSYHKDRIAIEFCSQNEFVKGYTETLFRPDSSLTREQFAVIWGRTFHLRQHGFTDVTRVPNEFENAILVMQALGHVNGISSTEFGRDSNISREQAVAIAHRAYLPGVDGQEAYKEYADYALISDWAEDSISACKSEGLLDGVFVGSELKPGQPITRGEICHLIFNIMRKEHTITIGATGDSTVTVTGKTGEETEGVMRYSAYPGETITLEVALDDEENDVLVEGSLKYNDIALTGQSRSFTMPFGDVTITAETAKQLVSIEAEFQGDKEYEIGDKLDLSNLVVKAQYKEGSEAVPVTGYTTDPEDGATLTYAGKVTLAVTYQENGITAKKDLEVTVKAKSS